MAVLSASDFEQLMTACRVSEPRPRLAVAVSGGADSLALVFLADEWARGRGGSVVALTVDHGLRPEAAGEARRVSGWLLAAGIEHHILTWAAPYGTSGVQEAARRARYDLLTEWCRDQGVLHLMLAHHRDDQAETYLMRKAKGSGPAGLAGMDAVALPPGAGARFPRILRPLLPVAKSRLEQTLSGSGREWISDPSNDDRAYTRVRLRHDIGAADDPGQMSALLAAEAGAYARNRAAFGQDLAASYARHLTVGPQGYALVRDRDDIPVDLAGSFWGGLLRTIAGRAYPPRRDRVERLVMALARPRFRGSALAGCIIRPWRRYVLVAREPVQVEGGEGQSLPPHRDMLWDNRFLVRHQQDGHTAQIRALGPVGVRWLNSEWRGARDWCVPPAVRLGLPALWLGDSPVALPVFAGAQDTPLTNTNVGARFVPPVPLVW